MEADILKYIQKTIPELSGRLFPIFTDDIESLSVAYQFSDISGGHLNHSQLTLNVIWNDYDKCLEMQGKLREILAMDEDTPFKVVGNTRFRSVLSAGGGQIFSEGPQMWEITKYYQIDWRTI